MLKKTITYEDYNGEKRTEDFYFNLNESELVELEVSQKKGLVAYLEAIIKTEDGGLIIDIFKKIILMAYGEKSEDGRFFIKNDTIKEQFASTRAYSNLFIELSTDAQAAAEFINGVVPSGLAKPALVVPNEAPVVSLPTPEPVDDLTSLSKEELLKRLTGK